VALCLSACGGGGDTPASDAAVDLARDVSDVPVADAAVCDVGSPPVPEAMLPQLTSTIVIAGGDAGAAPTPSGGDPSGRWVMRSVTFYLPAQAQGQIRPETSTITGTGWMVVEGDRYRIATALDLSIDTAMVGRLRSGQGIRGRGTFAQAGAALTLMSECATMAAAPDGGAPMLSLGVSRDGAERGRLFVTTRGALGSALLVFDMERIP